MPARHFSPPWTVDDNGTCFIVRDHNGQALAYCYYEVETGCRPNPNRVGSLLNGIVNNRLQGRESPSAVADADRESIAACYGAPCRLGKSPPDVILCAVRHAPLKTMDTVSSHQP